VVEAAAVTAARGRRRLAIVWLVLAALVASIVVLEYRERWTSGSVGDDSRNLLAAPLDQLGAIEIADRGRLHRFERAASGAWFYHGMHAAGAAEHTHTADPELAERIARAFAALARTRIEREFSLERDGAAYGVTTPDVLLLVYRPGDAQPLAQYAVGHVAPDTASRYVMRVGRPVVMTIPSYQIDNLLSLVQAAAERVGAGAAAR
jgi:Domain of unknown function (DUF4340)